MEPAVAVAVGAVCAVAVAVRDVCVVCIVEGVAEAVRPIAVAV